MHRNERNGKCVLDIVVQTELKTGLKNEDYNCLWVDVWKYSRFSLL